MLIIKDAPIIGQQSGTGLIVPGAVVFGNGGTQPDYSPIDLTATSLDSRVRYQCASQHAYYGADGLLHYAGPDECPVEYVNGVAVGRHEPEPQRTNLVKNNTTIVTPMVGNYCTSVDSPVTTPAGTVMPLGAKYYNTNVGSGLYCRTYDPLDVNAVASGFSIVPVISRAFIERITTPDYDYINNLNVWERWVTKKTTPKTTSFSGTMSVYSDGPSIANTMTWPWGWQYEYGDTATSTILTTGTEATRGASFLLVEMQGARGIRVWYTSGEYDEYPANGDAWFPLPWAKKDWGVRYIPTIEYIT
ncbi:hypothetical protein [Limnobaculum xujianqingii]|uniref:hypothetical protein n=1 Tax=Limnobaculum xujianqingii TaxID=2738837 RepID=UPI0015B94B03|nr:hypothetical protein [Limnobaculum xujianqingii]